jgi:hypothetical protein
MKKDKVINIEKQKLTKANRLLYVVMILWIIFGILGIYFNTNLQQVAVYYSSMTLFIGAYLFGEYKSPSDDKTLLFTPGSSSTREISVYITLLLWILLGLYGMFKSKDLTNLAVYFTSLTTFVTSYILYKTAKGQDTPVIPTFNTENNLNKEQKETIENVEDKINTVISVVDKTPLAKNDTIQKVEGAIKTITENITPEPFDEDKHSVKPVISDDEQF